MIHEFVLGGEALVVSCLLLHSKASLSFKLLISLFFSQFVPVSIFSSTSLFPFKPYGCIFQVKEENKYKVLHHIKLHFPKWGNTTRTHEIQFVTYENNKITPSSSSAWNIMMFKWFYTVHEIIFIFYMSDSIQPFNLEN